MVAADRQTTEAADPQAEVAAPRVVDPQAEKDLLMATVLPGIAGLRQNLQATHPRGRRLMQAARLSPVTSYRQIRWTRTTLANSRVLLEDLQKPPTQR